MEKTPEVWYQERAKRLTDAAQLRVPDRVPVFFNLMYFPAKYAGIPFSDAFYKLDSWLQAFKKTLLEVAPDGWGQPRNESGNVLEALGYQMMKWPGNGIDPNHTHQWIESEYMKGDEYDQFLEDPADYLIRVYLPRIYKTLEPLNKLPSLTSTLFSVPPNVLATAEFEQIFATLLKTAKEASVWRARWTDFMQEMRDLGFPTRGDARVVSPFDIASSYLRGMRGSMLDMYRRPEKLLKVCDWVLRTQVRSLEVMPKPTTFTWIFIPLHRGSEGFMNNKQFETFYWPYVKQLVQQIVDMGLTPYVLFEGEYGSRLHYLLEFPKGKVVCAFDTTDMGKAKSVLGGHVCLMGNVPSSILQTGTADDVKNYCRKLIDTMGKDGGFILAPRSTMEEAKPENVKAMVNFTKEYGIYQ